MWLSPVTTTAPETGAVTLAAAKEFVRIASDDTSFDVELQALLDSAIEDAERITGTRLITQTVLCATSCWRDLCDLPVGPVVSVASIKYLDPDGAEQTLGSDQYRLTGGGMHWAIVRQIGASWPAIATQPDAVRASVVCGYGATPASIPAAVSVGILRLVRAGFDGQAIEPVRQFPKRRLVI